MLNACGYEKRTWYSGITFHTDLVQITLRRTCQRLQMSLLWTFPTRDMNQRRVLKRSDLNLSPPPPSIFILFLSAPKSRIQRLWLNRREAFLSGENTCTGTVDGMLVCLGGLSANGSAPSCQSKTTNSHHASTSASLQNSHFSVFSIFQFYFSWVFLCQSKKRVSHQ